MQIKKVYATSKGLFWSMEEAELRKNRARDTDSEYYRGDQGKYCYEPVREVYVLIADVEQDQGISKVFQLNLVEVKP